MTPGQGTKIQHATGQVSPSAPCAPETSPCSTTKTQSGQKEKENRKEQATTIYSNVGNSHKHNGKPDTKVRRLTIPLVKFKNKENSSHPCWRGSVWKGSQGRCRVLIPTLVRGTQACFVYRYSLHHIPQSVRISECVLYLEQKVFKRDPTYTAGGNVNWCYHYGKQYGGSSKN